jgi:hypothetical protein
MFLVLFFRLSTLILDITCILIIVYDYINAGYYLYIDNCL